MHTRNRIRSTRQRHPGPCVRSRSGSEGFSLIELIIYVGVLSLVLISLTNMAFIIQSSRYRFNVLSDVHAAAERVISTIDFLVRNADGFVDDASGNDCFYTNKLWLYFATSSARFLPPGCSGDYATTAVSIENAGTDGTEGVGGYGIVVDGSYIYAITNEGLTKRYAKDLSLDRNFGTNGIASISINARDLALSDGYLYVAGKGTNYFAVEKYIASTGALDTTFDGDGMIESAASGGTYPRAIAVDANAIYLAGDNENDWHIEKRSKFTGALCTAGVCDGNAFDTDGVLDLTGNYYRYLFDMVIDGSYMYMIGDYAYHTGGIPGTNWDGSVVEKRLLTTGAVDTNFGGGDGNILDNFTKLGSSIAIDGAYLYIAGQDPGYWKEAKIAKSDGTTDTYATNNYFQAYPWRITTDGTYMYVTGMYTEGANNLVLEKRRLSDLAPCDGTVGVCDDIDFGSNAIGYFIGDVGSDGGRDIAVSGSMLYVLTDIELQKRDASTAALVPYRQGVQLLCYQNYPNVGKNADCSSDPLNSHTQSIYLTDIRKIRIGSTDLSFATTTTGSGQAIETTLNVGFDSESLLPNFSIATYTTSSTAPFRKTP